MGSGADRDEMVSLAGSFCSRNLFQGEARARRNNEIVVGNRGSIFQLESASLDSIQTLAHEQIQFRGGAGFR